MSDVPPGWAWTTLGGISEKPQYGWTTKADHDCGGLKLLRTTDITSGSIDWASVPACTEEPPIRDKYLLATDDIVVSRAGSVGASIRVIAPPPSVFASYLIRLRVRAVESSYVSWYLRSSDYWRQIRDASAGIALLNVNAKKLAAITLPVPPLNEQRRIVAAIEEHLSRLDAADASLAIAIARLKPLRAKTLIATLDGQWPAATVGRVAEVSSGPAFKSAEFRGPGEGIPLLRGENIEPGSLRWRDTRTWPESRLDGCEHLFVRSTDLILGMDRPVISTGLKLAPVRERDLPALLVQRVARIRPSEHVVPAFLHAALQLPRFIPHVISDQTGTQLPHITLAGIRSFEIPLPPLSEQRRIVQEVEERLSAIDALRSAIERAQRRSAALRRAVLERAFQGELVPQDPSDEPAEALLARIRAKAEAASSTRLIPRSDKKHKTR